VEIKQSLPEDQAQQPEQLTYSAPTEQGKVDVHKEANPKATGAAKGPQRPTQVPPKSSQGGQGSSFFKS